MPPAPLQSHASEGAQPPGPSQNRKRRSVGGRTGDSAVWPKGAGIRMHRCYSYPVRYGMVNGLIVERLVGSGEAQVRHITATLAFSDAINHRSCPTHSRPIPALLTKIRRKRIVRDIFMRSPKAPLRCQVSAIFVLGSL